MCLCLRGCAHVSPGSVSVSVSPSRRVSVSLSLFLSMFAGFHVCMYVCVCVSCTVVSSVIIASGVVLCCVESCCAVYVGLYLNALGRALCRVHSAQIMHKFGQIIRATSAQQFERAHVAESSRLRCVFSSSHAQAADSEIVSWSSRGPRTPVKLGKQATTNLCQTSRTGLPGPLHEHSSAPQLPPPRNESVEART